MRYFWENTISSHQNNLSGALFAYFVPMRNDIILSNQFAAVLLWCESEVLAEDTDEIRHVRETYCPRHLRDGHLRTQQQGLGMVYLLADDVL